MSESPREIDLVIESLASSGDGVGRDASGRVVFVPFAAPGDRLRVAITEEHPRFARGEIREIVAPGASRVAAPCPVFGRCGGCAWQHVAYEAQVEAKRRLVQEALARIGGVDAPAVAIVVSPAPYGYRGRTRVLAEGGRVGYRERRSHALCATAACPILAPPLDAALGALAARGDVADGEWELALGAGDAVRTTELPAGAGERLALDAAGERLEISPGVFAQANALLYDALAGHVVAAAGEGGEVLELFAGAGFFTLALARRFARLTAVESDARAVADLARNLAAAGLRHVRVVEARAEIVLADASAQRIAPDVVVLDPPRGGIGAPASRRLARLRAHRIVHVSCDPATLARDLRELIARGFAIADVTAFDLFPQTPHVETVVRLERAPLRRAG